MVLFKATMVAVAVLVVGVLLLSYGGQYITMTVQNVQRREVEPHSEFLVGDVVEKEYSLPAAVTVVGSLKVTQAPTNQTGDVRFRIFNDANFQKWNIGGQADSSYSSERQGEFNFTFVTSNSGVYHFVFDNRASVYKKYIVFSVAYNEAVMSQVPEPRLQHVAWAMLVGGALLLIIGLVRKPPVRWA
jgi:hypothetical protein